jgi:hypothetical protein
MARRAELHELEKAMPLLIRRTCIFLLALPLAALADPVTVTTHSSGTIIVNDSSIGEAGSVLIVLGLNPLTNTAPLPYELTLTSTFDTDTMVPPDGFWAHDYGGDVVIDFHIGTQVYHYAGPANSTVNLTAQSANVEEYSQLVWFDTPYYSFGFYHQLLGPPGSMGFYKPLNPLYADENDGLSGRTMIYLDPYATDVQDVFSIQAGGPVISVNVAAVPEPAPFALLAAGLLTLGWRWRSGRASV